MSNLPEKMKAIVAYAPGDYRFEMVDTPRAGERGRDDLKSRSMWYLRR